MARRHVAGGHPRMHGDGVAGERHPHLAATGRGLASAFWALAAGVIVAYVFFLALGAFGSAEVGVVTGVVVGLSALWVVHALLDARRRARDPLLRSERERRGF
ncbi:hypothetical protein [Conexibacter arvalis]|uniref:Fatty acid desaturase n=1 Tax=Conexibacter arvalis TaxID=912552 RepID=A0A840IGJ7_9ACTN|nr:hypothetical protein [Conexibacter arvalis]MBB4663992.1 fatty acid desaturase [Conexibacter arvalis]